MSGEHAPLPPSFAPVWGRCAGAVKASKNRPNVDTDDTLAGNAAHWVLSETLTSWRDAQLPPECRRYLDHTAPNGVVIDEAMVEGAQIAVDNVRDVLAKHNGDDYALFVEHRVHMPTVHAEHNWGTLDAAVVIFRNGRVAAVYLWDYKHGHREVFAKGNLQLIDYMEGLRTQFGIDGFEDQNVMVVFRIVQPFCYRSYGPIDTWCGKLSDLRGDVNVLHFMAATSLSHSPKCTTGPHCRDCWGFLSLECAAARKASFNFVDLVNAPYRMDKLTGHDLAVERRIVADGLTLAKARAAALDDEIKARIRAGETDTGLTLATIQGRKVWTIPPKQAQAMASQFGFTIAKDDVLTPRQSVQAAPVAVRKVFEKLIDDFTDRPVTGTTLVDAENSVTARAFGQNSKQQ